MTSALRTTLRCFLLIAVLIWTQTVTDITPAFAEAASESKPETTAAPQAKPDPVRKRPRIKKGEDDLGDKMMKFIRGFFEGEPPTIDEKLIRDDF